MFELRNKTIIIASPQDWGEMHISKHHYAIGLVNRQNEVYFVVLDREIKEIEIKKTEYKNLFIVRYNTFFPYNLKFHFRKVFDFFMKFQISRILTKINKKIDVFWCFDFNLYSNLNFFRAKYNIYHPVDPVIYKSQINPAKNADLIISVSDKILSNFSHFNKQQNIINHGIEKHFENLARNTYSTIKSEKKKVGYIGNLLRSVIDRKFLRTIISENNNIDFHFWGPLNSESSNIGGNSDNEVLDFVSFLQKKNNVILHGVLKKEEMIKSIIKNKIDVFVLVYKFKTGESDRSNAHKLIEYLATSKVVVANHFSAYKNFDDLIVMPKDDDDLQIIDLFYKVINNLEFYNSPELQKKRIEFALDNTYEKQIRRIEKIISE